MNRKNLRFVYHDSPLATLCRGSTRSRRRARNAGAKRIQTENDDEWVHNARHFSSTSLHRALHSPRQERESAGGIPWLQLVCPPALTWTLLLGRVLRARARAGVRRPRAHPRHARRCADHQRQPGQAHGLHTFGLVGGGQVGATACCPVRCSARSPWARAFRRVCAYTGGLLTPLSA